MKAIQTKYLGPTNTLGSRIVASAEGWGKAVIPCPDEFSNEKAHFQAVKALIDKVNKRIDSQYGESDGKLRHLTPPTVYGGTPDGCWVWCYPESTIED